MRKWRRWISVIMFIVMLTTLIPSGAMAAEAPTGASTESAAVIEPQEETEEAVEPASDNDADTAGQEQEAPAAPEDATEGASVSDVTEGAEAASEGNTEEAAAVAASTSEVAAEEEPSEDANSENGGEASTEDAAAGMTSNEVAPEIEPKTKATKALKAAGQTELISYLEGKTSVTQTLTDKDGNIVSRSSDGKYHVSENSNSYHYTLQTGNITTLDAGTYYIQLDSNFEYSIDDDNQILRPRGIPFDIGEAKIQGTRLIIELYDEVSDAQNYGLNINADIEVKGYDGTVGKIGTLVLELDGEDPTTISIKKTHGSYTTDVKANGTYVDRIPWTTTITCGEQANIAGQTITDAVGSTTQHNFSDQDKSAGVKIVAKNGSTTAEWTVKQGSAGFSWNSTRGWTYTMPNTVPSNAKSGAGSNLASGGWKYTITYYTTLARDWRGENNPAVTCRNTSSVASKSASSTYEIDDPPLPVVPVGSVDRKTGSWVGEGKQYEKIAWTTEVTLKGNESWTKDDVFSLRDYFTLGSEGNSAVTAVSRDKSPEWTNITATITIKGKTETVQFEEGAKTSSVSESGYYFEVRQFSDTSGNITLGSGETAPVSYFYLYNTDPTIEGSGIDGVIMGDVKITLSYELEYSTEIIEALNENNKKDGLDDNTNGDHLVGRQRYYVWNHVNARKNGVIFSSNNGYVSGGEDYKEQRSDVVPTKSNDYLVRYRIKWMPTPEMVGTQEYFTLIDTLDENMVFLGKAKPEEDIIVYIRDTTDTRIARVECISEYDPDSNTLTMKIENAGQYFYEIWYYVHLTSDTAGNLVYQNKIEAEYPGEVKLIDSVNGVKVGFEPWARRYSITVHKVDDQNTALKDAKIGVYYESNEELFAQKTTDSEGNADFVTNANEGIIWTQNTPYYVQEIEAPEGYQLNDGKQYFVISEEGFDNYHEDSYWADYFANKGIEDYEILKAKTPVGDEPYASGEFTIINTPDNIEIPVTKVWSDADDQDGLRPESVQIKLLANGEETGDVLELTADGNWKGTFTDLPKTDANGAAITYTVTETAPSGYTFAVTGTADKGFTVTNTHEPEVIDIPVTKEWNDSDNQDGLRPESIQVKLTADGTQVGTVQTLDESNKWTYTWTNLPKYKAGKEIVYKADEVETPADYTKAVSGSADKGFTITNSHGPVPVSVSVEKIWDDNNNQDGLRPESIQVQLKADGAASGDAVTLPTEGGSWSYTWEDLPAKKAGKDIVYSVDEVSVPEGYTKTVTPDASKTSYTITNTHTPEVIDIPVEKIWDDNNNQDAIRPTSIQVKLTADGTQVGDAITLNARNGWKYTWTNQPKYSAGKEIVYKVDEVAVPTGYTKTVSGNAATGFKIKNTHSNDEVSVSVEKVWDDADNQDGIRPESIQVQLKANGVVKGEAVTLPTEDGSWSYTWEGLTKNEAGTAIVYTVDEVSVPEGYTKTVSGDGTVGYTITNKHTPEQTEVSVEKVWADANDQDGKRPESIQVQLKAGDEAVGDAVTLPTAEGAWSYTWTGLDKYKTEGEEIAYTVDEVEVPENYTKKVTGDAKTGYVITNSYTPGKVTVDVQKVWDDDDNRDGVRPASIEVELKADGASVEKQTLNAGNNWYYEWADLDEKVDITGEKELKGATLQILDSEENVVVIKDRNGDDVTLEWVSEQAPKYIEGLKTGTEYILRETIAPDGYTIATDVRFSIDTEGKVTSSGKINESGVLLIEDEPTKVKVSKADITGEEELQGATLQILDSEGNIVEIKDNDGNVTEKLEWVSTKEPKYIEGLLTGVEYTLRETIAPDGYTIATDTTFSIDKTGKVTSTGSISIDEEGVTTMVVNDDITKVKISKVEIGAGEELPGATLQILDGDGNVVEIKDNDGNVIETCEWVSGTEPKYIEGLKTGVEYTLRETIAPDGYTITSDTKFTIDEKGVITSSGTTSKDENGVTILVVEDDLTHITVSKVDTGAGEELPGALIQIIDEDGNVVEEWTSTTEPHQIDGLLTGKTYILREKVAPLGYTLTSDTTFTIDEYGKVTSTGTVNQEGMLVIEDTITVVDILKVDAKTGKGLAGAKLQVLDDNGTVCEEWTSTAEPHRIAGLYTGVTYTLHEVSAPKGYKVAKDVTFKIDEYGKVSGDTVKDGVVIMKDEQNPPQKNKTGDGANATLWALLLALAGSALGGTVWFRRRRRV